MGRRRNITGGAGFIGSHLDGARELLDRVLETSAELSARRLSP